MANKAEIQRRSRNGGETSGLKALPLRRQM